MVIAISSLTKADIVERFGVDPERVRVTLLGTAVKFKPIERAPNPVFTIGYLGRFDGYKDVAFLIRAYAVFEKANPGASRLVLYGKGAKYAECMELSKSLGLKGVEFRGFAAEGDIASIYNSFDLFVFPSNLEGFGLPIVEAQKCHVPVIVKGAAHIPEEVTRYCLKAKDEEHMAALMGQVMKGGFVFSPEHLKHLEEFSLASCARKTLAVYEEALGRK
jgi:glycosyltransferase involved in cell wall biosynthesis